MAGQPEAHRRAPGRLGRGLLCFRILLVELLNHLHIGSLPLGFWFAQQGAIYVFVVLIFVYAWRMDKLDRKFGMSE